MVEIYRSHMQTEAAESGTSARERLPLRETVDRNPGEYKNAALTRLENRFPRLHNPDLVMYVLPHLVKAKHPIPTYYPIPGYVTVFPMYETVEYAMPGEAPVKRMPVKKPSAVAVQKDVQRNESSTADTPSGALAKNN